MAVFKHENGVVTQVWRDVKGLAEFAEKYGPSPSALEGDAVPGMLWDGHSLTLPDPKKTDAPRDLSPVQFEYLLSLTGFGEVWDQIAADAKAAGDRATYAALMAERKRARFRLDVVLAVVARFADQVPQDVDLSEATIRAAWKDAEQFGGLA